jgi:hypothetical protein
MSRCWAQCLGDCDGGISGEHIVSAGLFKEDILYVNGPPWKTTSLKPLTKKVLVKNILCVRHNNALSPVDAEAANAMNFLRERERLSTFRNLMRLDYWRVPNRVVDGLLFERCFLKTLINIEYEGERPIGPLSQLAGAPSDDLVRIAYGQEKFKERAGLYVAVGVGQSISNGDGFEYMPMANGRSEDNLFLPGALFIFRGLTFILYLGEKGMDANASLILPERFMNASVDLKPMYHLRKTIDEVQGRTSSVTSQTIEFKW